MPRVPVSSWAVALGLSLLAPAAIAEPAAAPKAPVAEPSRLIEKTVGEYVYRLTLRPGTLEPGQVADVSLEMHRSLEIPDPIAGDRLALRAAGPIATVEHPTPDTAKRVRGTPAKTTRHLMWPLARPGEYGFHFTPAADGAYELRVEATDSVSEQDEKKPVVVTFRIGVGTAAELTEQSQGTAAGRRARRPIGARNETANQDKLETVMREVGRRFLSLEQHIGSPPARGANAAAAAEARAIAALLGQLEGSVPSHYASAGSEFNKLAAGSATQFEAIAAAADKADSRAATKAFEALEMQTCLQCHAKFRYGLTTDLSEWPSYRMKPWKK